MSTRRLGILGGTFDPIHIGHLIIAEEARARFGLDKVLFVPARISPHKLDDTPADGEHRFRMVEIAVAGNPGFCASRVDLDRPGPSYTVDMLEELRLQFQGADFCFIMGMDSLEHLDKWRQPIRLLRLAHLVVVTRPGHKVSLDALDRRLPGLRDAVSLLDTVNVGISSTDIRERVRRGMSIRYQVPADVYEYIRDRGLYLTPEKGDGEKSVTPCS